MGRWIPLTLAGDATLLVAAIATWLATGPRAPDDALRVLLARKILTMDPYEVEPEAIRDIEIWGTVFEGRPHPIP